MEELERDVCFWASLEAPDVQGVEPADRVLRADEARLDRVAEAFAGIVDAKSPYTARHCAGVAEIADGIASTMASTTRHGGFCAARRSCTTSASSGSPTASSTSPAH